LRCTCPTRTAASIDLLETVLIGSFTNEATDLRGSKYFVFSP
jgi:hypothetical protein